MRRHSLLGSDPCCAMQVLHSLLGVVKSPFFTTCAPLPCHLGFLTFSQQNMEGLFSRPCLRDGMFVAHSKYAGYIWKALRLVTSR